MVSVRPRGEDTGGGLVGSGGAGPASPVPSGVCGPESAVAPLGPQAPPAAAWGRGRQPGPGRPVVPARGGLGRSVSGHLCARSSASPHMVRLLKAINKL